MEPYGDETEDGVLCGVRGAGAALSQDGGADAVIVETMMATREECLVAVRAVRENTNLTCLASFSFDPQPDGGYASMMGVTPEAFAQAAVAGGCAHYRLELRRRT